MAKKKSANAAADAVGSMRVQPDQIAEQRSKMQSATGEQVEIVELDDEQPMSSVETHGTEEPLERAVVENGRTVHAPLPGQRRVVGWVDGKQIYGPVTQAFGPGQMVMLPRSEVKRLRECGFLVDPDRRLKEPPGERMEIVNKNPPPTQGARVTQS